MYNMIKHARYIWKTDADPRTSWVKITALITHEAMTVFVLTFYFDYPLSNDSVCTNILSDPSSPLIVLPYSLLCLDCWSSRFSIFVTSSLYLYSNSLAFSATSVRGNDRNGKTRTIRNVPQRMNPPHHAPIHSGSPGRILTSKLNIST